MSEMFHKYMALTIEQSPATIVQSHQMILESGLFLVEAIHGKIAPQERNEQVNDALAVFQMVLGKGLAIQRLIQGLDFDNPINGLKIRGLIDPTTISVLTRTQFEAFANFHNIYNSTDNTDLKNLLYDMWVISGLKARQASGNGVYIQEEHRIKAEQEKQKIERIKESIFANPCYLELSEEQKKWIKERIKKRDFELLYKDGKFSKPGWSGLYISAGVNDVFLKQYSLLSLNTHPSNVSVFQYNQMFDKGFNVDMAFGFMNQSTIIMSFMIAEYCKYFDLAKANFSKLPDLHQLLVDSYNGNFRSREHEISDIRSRYSEEFQKEYEKMLRLKKL